MTKYLGKGCGKDIGGIPCGEFIETDFDYEKGVSLGQYYYCEECLKKFKEINREARKKALTRANKQIPQKKSL